MEKREIGKSGIEASVVAFGSWALGGWMWGGTGRNEAEDAILAALDQGVNFIDTAPIYGWGLSEILLGRALEGKRDQVVLATKCGMVANTREGEFKFNATAAGVDENGHVGIYVYLKPESIRREVEGSLKRLKTDYIDLYQTHWQEEATPREDTMAELLKLKDEGKIRAIGVSNCSAEQMKEYREVGQLDSDQEQFSMIDRQIEDDQLPYCRENDIAVLAYSPMAMGLLTGKMTPDREFNEGDIRQSMPRFSVENRKRINKMLDSFSAIAERHDATTAQLTIAWTFHQPGLTHVLCGARNPDQATENAKAGSIELSNDELKQMDEAIDEYRAVSEAE